MDIQELFGGSGLGVMATAALDGSVNTAIYARPHVMDETTLVWGMTEGRTWRNLSENPRASYLFRSGGRGVGGVRLTLEKIRSEEDGALLDSIRRNSEAVVGPGAGRSVTHAVWFRVVEVRPLVSGSGS